MRRLFFGFNLIMVVFSCTDQNSNKSQVVNVDNSFKSIIEKIQILDYPINFNSKSLSQKAATSLQLTESDSIFFGADYYQYSNAFGMLPDTTNFYAIIFEIMGDDPMPYLATFNKIGKKIDGTFLFTGCADGGLCTGNYYCSKTARIDAEFKLNSTDTIINMLCDSIHMTVIDSTLLQITTKRMGVITNNGKIVLNEYSKGEVIE